MRVDAGGMRVVVTVMLGACAGSPTAPMTNRPATIDAGLPVAVDAGPGERDGSDSRFGRQDPPSGEGGVLQSASRKRCGFAAIVTGQNLRVDAKGSLTSDVIVSALDVAPQHPRSPKA